MVSIAQHIHIKTMMVWPLLQTQLVVNIVTEHLYTFVHYPVPRHTLVQAALHCRTAHRGKPAPCCHLETLPLMSDSWEYCKLWTLVETLLHTTRLEMSTFIVN